MKESIYQEYLKFVAEFNGQVDITIIKNNVNAINNIMYKEEVAKNLDTRIYAYVDKLFLQLKSSYKQIELLKKINFNDNEYKNTTDINLKQKYQQEGIELRKQLAKEQSITETNKANRAFNEQAIKEDIAKLPTDQQNMINAYKKAIDQSYNNLENKMVASKKVKSNNEKTNNDSVISIQPNYKQEYEELLKKYNEEKTNREELEKLRKEIEEMKNNTFKEKLKRGAKKVGRKVIAVKDLIADNLKEIVKHPIQWTKEHKKLIIGTMITVAVAGIVVSTITTGVPWLGAARIMSSLWHPLKHIGLGDSLHGINDFLLGNKVVGATFDPVEGLWSVGGKVLNDIGVFEGILRSLEGVAIAGTAVYGTYKLGKVAWLALAKTKFGKNLKEKINNRKEKTTNLAKTALNKVKKPISKKVSKKNDNSNLLPEIDYGDYNYLTKLSIPELQEYIDTLEKMYVTGNFPVGFEDITINELPLEIQAANEILKDKLNPSLQSDTKEYITNSINELTEEQLDMIINDLQSVIDKYRNNEIPEQFNMFADGAYGLKNIKEVEDLYNFAFSVYINKFGGRTL